jgi:methyl-accepting chemotaxis protein
MAANLDNMLNKIDSKLDEVSDAVYKIDKEVALQKAAFDEHIKQDEKMYEEFKRMNDILSANTESLKEHMQRTAIAEQRQHILEDLVKSIDSRLSPFEQNKLEEEAVRKYRNEKLKKIAKILGIIATLVAIVAGLKTL